jgi:hypothetical protein
MTQVSAMAIRIDTPSARCISPSRTDVAVIGTTEPVEVAMNRIEVG